MSSQMSNHHKNSSQLSTHASPIQVTSVNIKSVGRVLMETNNRHDEIIPIEEYQDVRIEMLASGHHLTSVLINPRETLMQNLFDEFANEQSLPLEYQTLYSSSMNASQHLFGLSTHSSNTTNTTSSTFSAFASSQSGRSLSGSNMTQLLSLTQTELEQLQRFIVKMNKLYEIYASAHQDADGHTRLRRSSSRDQSPAIKENKQSMYQTISKSQRFANEDLRSCYRDVPEIFFQSNFSLANQDIFNKALLIFDLNRSESLDSIDLQRNEDEEEQSYTPRKLKQKQSPKQVSLLKHRKAPVLQPDKLSHYLDLVEVALLRQIWSRSPAFFRALDDLKGLQYEVSQAIQILLVVRRRLLAMNERSIKQSLRIPKLSRRQQNISNLQQKLQLMRQLVEGRAMVLTFLECEDYYTAQELIYSIKDIYWNDLKDIHAMKAIGNQLQEFQVVISEVLCNKFATYGIQWDDCNADQSRGNSDLASSSSLSPSKRASVNEGVINDYINELDSLSSFLPQSASVSAVSAGLVTDKRKSMIAEQKQDTKKLFHALLASEQFHVALSLYRNRLIDGIKLIIRTCVMEYLNGVMLDSLSILDDSSAGYSPEPSLLSSSALESADTTPFVLKVREMSTEHFLSCLSMCFEHLTLSLQKAYMFHEFIRESMESLRQSAVLQHSEQQLGEKEIALDSPKITSENRFHFAETSSSFPHHLFSGNFASSSFPQKSFVASCLLKINEQVKQEFLQMSKSSLSTACEIVQKSIIQLINFRKDINAKFSLDKMIFLWEISLQFVHDLEGSNFSSNAFPFRQCLLMQTKLFLDHLHEQSKNRLVSTLNSERWIQSDVTVERQLQIDRLSSGKAFLTKSSSSTISKIGGESSIVDSNNNNSAPLKKGRDKELHPAQVEGQEYKVVWSVLLLIEIVLSYLEIVFHFPAVTNEVLHKIVEIIRLFNTRTKQLVLGAQAIQLSTGLRSISAKHLAITGQSLGLFIALLPHIRAALLAQVPPNKQTILSTELDRISQDLFDHHAQIMSKFVNIVSDMVEQFATTKLKSIDWDRFPPSAVVVGDGPSVVPAIVSGGSTNNASVAGGGTNSAVTHYEYFEEIQKNIVTLHKVLRSILPTEQIQDIFTRIFALLNRKLVHHFEEIMPSTPTGKQRILDEITYLVSSLSSLKSVDASLLTSQLEESFRKKYARL